MQLIIIARKCLLASIKTTQHSFLTRIGITSVILSIPQLRFEATGPRIIKRSKEVPVKASQNQFNIGGKRIGREMLK